MANPRKTSIFDGDHSDRRQAAREVEMVRQNDQIIALLGQLLAAQQETNRLLAHAHYLRTGNWPSPPPQ